MRCRSFSISGAFLLNLIATQGIVTPKKEKKKPSSPSSHTHSLEKWCWLRTTGLDQLGFTLVLNYVCIVFFFLIGLEGREELSSTEVLLSGE